MCQLNQIAGVLPVRIFLDLPVFFVARLLSFGAVPRLLSLTYQAVSWCSSTACMKLWQIRELTNRQVFHAYVLLCRPGSEVSNGSVYREGLVLDLFM